MRRGGVLAVAVMAVLVAACSSSGGATTAPASTAPSAAASAGASAAASGGGVAPKDAKNAAEAGGVDAVCAAGKAEGQVTLIATPNNWANYGQMITDFQTKYGIKVQSDKPDANSQQEIDQAKQLAGTGRQPDIFDLGSVVAAAHTDMYAPSPMTRSSAISPSSPT
jgi:putative spermidine/putrescine transport system substrate-binding protein